MRRTNCCLAMLHAVLVALLGSAAAWAVPYASGVRNIGGNTFEFVLNAPADAVTVLRDGGNPLNLGALSPGRHTFDMNGFSSWDIHVSRSAPLEWSELSVADNLYTRFERPVGLAVNNDPASPYFGTIYVGNSTTLSTAVVGDIPARPMGDGIYTLTADQIGVDLSTANWAVPDPDDVTQARRPNWTTDQSLTAEGAHTLGNVRSPWRFSLDAAGNIIAADWSIETGGFKWATPDLTEGGDLMAGPIGNPDIGVRNADNQDLHSRIMAQPQLTGTLGVDLTITAIDTWMPSIADEVPERRRNVWRWNLEDHDPATMGPYSGANVPTPTEDPVNGRWIVPELIIRGFDLGGDAVWFHSVPAVLGDVYYSQQHDLYYLTQPRSDGNQASLIIVDANLQTDPTGQSPIVVWNSLAWTRENNLDGCVLTSGTATVCGPGIGPISADTYDLDGTGQDIFRMTAKVEISPDGSTMFIRRQQVMGNAEGTAFNENPVMGLSTTVPWAVVAIPLDENGLPIIELVNEGTHEAQITNFTGFQTASPGGLPGNHELEFDIAGNAYATHSGAERLQVFSPGGSWTAITSSDGTFMLVPLDVPDLPGDYNQDGIVDAADYTLWRDNVGTVDTLANDPIGGTIGQAQYDQWKQNFGATAPGAGTVAGAVPEPSALLLAMVGLVGLAAVRRRASA